MKRKHGVLTQRIEDGFIVYDPGQDEAFVLNETAALVWENADLPESEIAKLLSNQYGITEHEALEDTRAFIKELTEKGLLV